MLDLSRVRKKTNNFKSPTQNIAFKVVLGKPNTLILFTRHFYLIQMQVKLLLDTDITIFFNCTKKDSYRPR